MAEAVIVAGARTPIGKLSGGLASFSAMELGGFAIAERWLGWRGTDQVDYVLMGQVLQADRARFRPAKQPSTRYSMSVPSNTSTRCVFRASTPSTWLTR